MAIRPLFVALHRWVGLTIAAFLLVAGLTGAVISWDHELDEALNGDLLLRPAAQGPLLSGLEVAELVEQREPRARVTYVPLELEPGHSAVVYVSPRVDPQSGELYELGYSQVFLDPVTGEHLGVRDWGKAALDRRHLLPFLYKLHYTMHIPDAWGIQLGAAIFGLVAILWVLDCFVALGLSFPNVRAWKKSFRFRWSAKDYRLLFDLHRSGGVWLWGVLLTLAVTAVSMNLQLQVVRPIVGLFSELTPSPFDATPNALTDPIEPQVTRAQVVDAAVREGAARELASAGAVFYAESWGVYGVGYFEPGNDHGDGGLGNAWMYFDGQTGELTSASIPGEGSAGDLFMQLQFPVHSGRIAGLTGRIFVSLLGLAVAGLSVTGVIIWWRKLRARHAAQRLARKAARALGGEPAHG